MLNIFELMSGRGKSTKKEIPADNQLEWELLSRRAGLPPEHGVVANKVAPEPSQLDLLRFMVNVRLGGVSVSLRLVDMLLDKLPEHPDNLDSARGNIESAIETLNGVLEDLKNYKD